jgi:hypothetical protein
MGNKLNPPMKFYSLLISLLLYATSYGQNWLPFVYNAKCIYGELPFSNNGNIYVDQVRFDSVYTHPDSITAFSWTRPYRPDSCLENAYREFRFSNWSHEAANRFFPNQMIIRNDTIFVPQKSSFFKLHAQKAETWTTERNDEVRFIADSTLTFLGITDSVKIYQVMMSGLGQDTVILSKNWGFIRLFHAALLSVVNDSVTLGVNIPKVQDSFKPRAGDILFFREEQDTFHFPRPIGNFFLSADTRDSITEVIVTDDSISVSLIREHKNYLYPQWSFSDKSVQYTYDVKSLNDLFEDGAIAQRFAKSFPSFVYKSNSIFSMQDSSLEIDINHMGNMFNCRFEMAPDICSGSRYNSSFIQIETSGCGSSSGGRIINRLIGYRLNNVKHGIITIGLSEAEEQLNRLSVYPNPAGSYIQLSEPLKASYHIHDLMGKSVAEGTVTETIELQQLGAGIYFLTLKTETGARTLKILKQ